MRIVFAGAGGHGKVCAHIAARNGYDSIIFLDDGSEPAYTAAGRIADFVRYLDSDTEFFVSVGNISARRRIQREIEKAGGRMATLVHPDAVVGGDVKTGRGVVIMARAVINPGTVIGNGVVINTGSVVEHDCRIGDYCHIAPCACLCGQVTAGEGSWIGAGATVIQQVDICPGCMIGAGAVVTGDIGEAGTYAGVPAVWVHHKEDCGFGYFNNFRV